VRVRILHQDQDLVVLEKPAGVQVHPPESGVARFTDRNPDLIRILRAQTGQRVFPVHRLDRATQGVMMMAFSSEVAGLMQAQFKAEKVRKAYLLMCRGWVPESGSFLDPLRSDHDPEVLKEACTDFFRLHHFELPLPSGRYSTSRFSMVLASPRTGRFHQIRRHFKGSSHPLIGDSVYGDGRQNRFWRELSGESRLYLLAWMLSFDHPRTGDRMEFRSRFTGSWHRVFDVAGFCPLGDSGAGRLV